MSRPAVSHRESLGFMSSPLRRKSMLSLSISDTNLEQNDDDAERLERRRSAQIEMRQHEVTSPVSNNRKSIGGSVAGLSAAQLAEHYAKCIKLSAENKINAKNAFSLQLIDYMAMMLKKQDSKMDNFQVASCTLDASTKIYAYRVDCVHADVLKMAGGLAVGNKRHSDKGEGEEEEDGRDESRENGEVMRTKKRSRKPKNTVATNVETLNGKTDMQPVMDPFLRCAGNMGECHPGDSRFLTGLKVLGNCALSSCSDLPYWDTNEKSMSSVQPHMLLPFIPNLMDKGICPVFSQFSFLKWSLDGEEEPAELVAPVLQTEDDEFAFDVNAVPEPVPAEENEEPGDHFEVFGVDEGMDSEGEDTGAPIACQPIHRTPAAKVVDIRRHLSMAPSEYSYFRADALEIWAGPSHWKIKPFKGMDQHGNRCVSADSAGSGSDVAVAYKKQKPKQKKELEVEFVTRHKSDKFTVEENGQMLKLVKRTMQKAWSVNRNTNPPDIHFNSKEFPQLELKDTSGMSVHPSLYEDDEPSGYDYENDHDTSEYCPNVALNDDLDDADGGPVDGMLASQHQDIHSSLPSEVFGNVDAYAGDNLVTPPCKVARIFIPYAMRAKKVDMKRLKHAMWDILVCREGCKDKENNENLRVERPVTFSDMYAALPSRLPSKLAENLSAPLAIVALLHLANEKTLDIEGNEDLSDLIITQAY